MSQRTARTDFVTVSMAVSMTAWIGAGPAPAANALPTDAPRF